MAWSPPLGRGPVFTAPFTATSLTTNAPMDLFSFTAPSNSRIAILEVRLAQYSKFGDANAGTEGLQYYVGSTAVSTAGAAITPVNVDRHTGSRASGITAVTGPSTVASSTTSATLIMADGWNVASAYWYAPQSNYPQMAIIVKAGEAFNLRLSTASEALTANGCLTFQEIGL